MPQFNRRSMGQRLKDTGFLLKNSFSIVGKDKDIKKPTLRVITFSIILNTLLWGSLILILLGTLTGLAWPVLILTLLILIPYRFFYVERQRADQSWIVYNAITGKDINRTEAHSYTKELKGKLRLVAFINLLMKYIGSQRSNNGGIGGLIINIFLASLREVWDLAGYYLLPAIVIEKKSLKEVVPHLKALRNNVPATLTGVFGIDFAGNIVGMLLVPAYIVLIAIGGGIGYLMANANAELAVVTLGGMTFSWLPIAIMIYIIAVIGKSVKHLVSAAKVIYYTIFYTSIQKPTAIKGDLQGQLTHYLKMEQADFQPKSQTEPTPRQKYINKLANYIKQYKESTGQTDAQIKQFLLSKGYPEKDINAAFTKANKK